MKVLIIEDEKRLAGILKKGLEENGFSVDLGFDGEDGLQKAVDHEYDALLLDIMLPRMDGFGVLSRLRAVRRETPVLIMSARGGVDDRIKGLNSGADDYIAKPFDFFELLARLKSVIRRSRKSPLPVIEVGDIAIDMNSRTVTRGGRDLHLIPKEYKLLEYLALNKGRVIGRSELRDHICDGETGRDSNLVVVYITHLRSKLEKDFGRKIIHTVRGEGYVLKEADDDTTSGGDYS